MGFLRVHECMRALHDLTPQESTHYTEYFYFVPLSSALISSLPRTLALAQRSFVTLYKASPVHTLASRGYMPYTPTSYTSGPQISFATTEPRISCEIRGRCTCGASLLLAESIGSVARWRERGGDDCSCGGSSAGCASMWLSAAGGAARGRAGGEADIITGNAASGAVSRCGMAILSENFSSRFSRCALSVQPASRAARKAAAT